MHPIAPHDLNATPAKVDVAFRALAYCRSLTDPQSLGLPGRAGHGPARPLSELERGVEAAALNLLRNYLNDEVELGPIADLQRSAGFESDDSAAGRSCPFQIPFRPDSDDEVAA